MYTREEIIQANREVHTAIGDRYLDEPHYRPENQARVREILKSLQEQTRGTSLLDVGCGMGFIIDLAKDYFRTIRGVDVTSAMLEKVCLHGGPDCDIQVKFDLVETLSFPDNSFDVCTAHALLHHLCDIRPALAEIYRVLKPGGIFYSDLDPNAYFWDAIISLNLDGDYNDIIHREIIAVRDKDQEIAEQFSVNVKAVQQAEYLKHCQGGFREKDLLSHLKEARFARYEVKYQWFLGEAQIIHGETTKGSASNLRAYLQNMLPLTKHLFKYLMIFAKK